MRDLVARKLDQNDATLRARFAEWEDWPCDAQLATLSMAWACGPFFRYPLLEAALKKRDWSLASIECHIDDRGNPGVKPRNMQNRMLYRNAGFAEDPGVLYWPRDLAAEAVTSPEPFAVVYALPDPPDRDPPPDAA